MAQSTQVSLLTSDDLYLFNEGTNYRLANKFGSHVVEVGGRKGTYFAVWAPNAQHVSVIGDFNKWDERANPLQVKGNSGVWEGFLEGISQGAIYKYRVIGRGGRFQVDKADPFAFHCETPPKTGSIVWKLDYDWADGDWMRERSRNNSGGAPWSIYEVHAGSWAKNGHVPDYRELAERLGDYVKKTGYTHVEFMPVMEHPFYGSWGYQTTGYFAPTSRQGTPQDFKYLVDHLHQLGIGVVLDWVPSHFPSDEHGLVNFDGTHLYEHADPRLGFHPDWKSMIFNYGRHEVRSFLCSSAMFWLDEYHADGLRVDAVASMLYLDYSRQPGEWVPNAYGGRENLEAIAFLRQLNEELYKEHPDIQTMAEESTAWPMVSRPTYVGGLGFGMKWDMGWMHDTLEYMQREPVHRKFHHNKLTFRGMYAFTENFVLPLSHDEVVHGKGSLIGKMPGDTWQKFANLRLLFAYMFASPGKKLMFMGDEFGQWGEWGHDWPLDWSLLNWPMHEGLRRWVGDLNALYRGDSALHATDFDPNGFGWIDADDSQQSVISFLRRDPSAPERPLIAAFNFTPVPRRGYRLGVPLGGFWTELLNGDAPDYGGSGQGNLGGVQAQDASWHGQPHLIDITLPPLAGVFFKPASAV
ncbi:MAG: 1,4-alpha-glucan branching protein GlgB [Chloroflexi bacterium]|nr:MAG: 1,4-alpha-glucan branching protein GlgB [Chloroflexota bacterium]